MAKSKIVKQAVKKSTKKNNIPLYISLICITTFIAFFPSLKNSMDIWDDIYFIANNPFIKTISWANINIPCLGNYQPLTMLSYSLEYHFFGTNPFLFHLDNIIIHLLNTSLLFWFIYKLTSKIPVAFVAAILFGIHPLHVESVTWISERKDVLYTLFYLAGLIFYLEYKEQKNKKFYMLAIFAFIFSCISKPMAVTFSAILILIDYLKEKKLTLPMLYEKIPFFVISLVYGFISIIVQQKGGAIGFSSNAVYTLSDRIFFANYSLFFYLYKMLIPVHLSGLYPYPVKSGAPLPLPYLISPLFNALFFFWIIYSFRRSKNVVFGCLFFFISIFPVLQILPVGAAVAADRYFYVASIGMFFLAGIGFNYIFENKKYIHYKSLLMVLSSVIVLLLGYLTFERTKIWRNSGVFWGNVAEEFPKLELPYYNRAAYYYGIKDYDSALLDFNKAIQINPKYKDALSWRSEIFTKKLQYQLAADDYNKLIEIDPNDFDAYAKLGELYGKYLNNINKAQEYLTKAYTLKPDNAANLDNLGIVCALKGDNKLAMQYFEKALSLNPNDASTLRNLGITYKNAGDEKKAKEYLDKADLMSKKQ